jgi:hypothetical protein
MSEFSDLLTIFFIILGISTIIFSYWYDNLRPFKKKKRRCDIGGDDKMSKKLIKKDSATKPRFFGKKFCSYSKPCDFKHVSKIILENLPKLQKTNK